MTKIAENKSSAAASKATTPFFNKGEKGASSAETEQPFFSKQGDLPIQTKLTIGQPNDRYEKEADTVADKVVQRMSTNQANGSEHGVQAKNAAPVVNSFIQTKCEHCEKEKKLQTKEDELNQESPLLHRKPIFDSAADLNEEQPVQRKCAECEKKEKLQKQSAESGAESGPGVEKSLEDSKGGGSPLPSGTRVKMENAIGADFSNVRVHTDSSAVNMNKQLGAHAFAHGSDIYFNSGKFDTNTKEGNHLLAHELTHTVQQGGSAVKEKKQNEKEESPLEKTNQPQVQGKWYNVSIPFTDYEFDPSLEGIKTAAGIVADKAAEAVEWIYDQIKDLVMSGLNWLKEQWESIQSYLSQAWDALKGAFGQVLTLVKSPLSAIMNAIMRMDGETLDNLWQSFSGFVTNAWKGFKALTDKALNAVNAIWGKISGFATSLLDKVVGLTENFVFRKLPSALQDLAHGLINQLKSLWTSIENGWNKVFGKVKKWIDDALDEVLQFVLKIGSFAMNVIIKGILNFGKLVLFLKDFFGNPKKYLSILAKKSVDTFSGLETRFAGLISTHFPKDTSKDKTPKASGTIQKSPDPQATTETKGTATWSEIGSGIWTMMGKKWEEFKKDPWSIVTGLLMDMFLPIVGNVKDVIKLFKDIWAIVTGPLDAGSFQELWTSFLKLVEIPLLIYQTIVSILMRSLMLALIVATFIKHPVVVAIATAVGWGLLALFAAGEVGNIEHKIFLLKTGATTKKEKEAAYNRIADALIAMAMTVVVIIVIIILHFIANVMKGIYNFIKGKAFGIEPVPGEGKAGEGKGGEEKKPATDPGKANEGTPSQDGKRRIKMNEAGKCEVCASPCDDIRRKYAYEITPEIEGKIKAIENDAKLTDPQKEVALKPIEQELANLKAPGTDITDQIKSGRIKPQGDKWRYANNWKKWVDRGGRVVEYGDGTFDLIDAKGNRVRYSVDGYPDFTPYLDHPSGVRTAEIPEGFDAKRYPDYKKANTRSGHPEWGDSPPDNYRWHHHQNGHTMQLVPEWMHTLFKHAGGISNL